MDIIRYGFAFFVLPLLVPSLNAEFLFGREMTDVNRFGLPLTDEGAFYE